MFPTSGNVNVSAFLGAPGVAPKLRHGHKLSVSARVFDAAAMPWSSDNVERYLTLLRRGHGPGKPSLTSSAKGAGTYHPATVPCP